MTTHDEIDALIARQRALLQQMNGLEPAARDVVRLGEEVLRFAKEEEAAFFPLLPLLDPAARAELGREHDDINEDVKLLDWLVSTTPESPDVEVLAVAIARRIRQHVERDGRFLARAQGLVGKEA